ncbi:MAG TPA: CinA family protein [Burkholderiales bacterium]|nr:CinA family protein [Burkholderiales bacterium]
MRELVERAERVAAHLARRGETIAVCESSSGGLIAAALLAVPGASAYFVGGMVIYTRQAYDALRDFDVAELRGARSATEENALVRADLARSRFGATWGLGETGAAGPGGNRYGDPAGHTCIGIAGAVRVAATLRTGQAGRLANMFAFTAAALERLCAVLESPEGKTGVRPRGGV